MNRLQKALEEMKAEEEKKKKKKKPDFLFSNGIDFDYDEKIKVNGYFVRPDFYLTEHAVIIEYWGMKGEPDYDESMVNKKRLYKEANQRFISIEPKQLNDLSTILKKKLQPCGISF